MSTLFSFGLGSAYQNSKGDYLDTFFPTPIKNASEELTTALAAIGYRGGNQTIKLDAEKLEELACALNAAGETEQATIASQLKKSTQAVVAVAL